MTLNEWATRYGVAHTAERTGFARYTVVLRFRGRELILPNVTSLGRPDLKTALRKIVLRARKADAVEGSFQAWSRKRRGRTLADLEAEWGSYRTALDSLMGVLENEATHDLLWAVRWK